ncbi:hypothetical protein AX14_007753 [Amanita brunnescens Koide BX004]|nr:hypothetical protein AX14_007753 [Amanita brunnescens Koide BX004]
MNANQTQPNIGRGLPPVPWAANKSALVWRLIGLIEESENHKVIVGKGKNENSSGDSKAKAYKHIAAKLLPAYHQSDPDTYKHTKAKWEGLCKQYQEKAKLLIQTGGGLDPADSTGAQEHQYKVPVTGPVPETLPEARNLWDKIVHDFPFFPQLHVLLSISPQSKSCCYHNWS